MKSKDKNSEYLNIEYKDVLKEEIRNFLEADSLNDENFSNKVNKYNKFKRTPLEIINRLLFFLFIGSFISSFASVYMESKTWFVFYVLSAFSCIFYTPNRKALKELIAAWPNVEDLIKGRSLWRKK
mgnify:CR=1 FL=1|tara:strand:+ start:73 stop:450 length:378 start_codon:yes stop_codon:yes gene_type:complete